MLAADHIVDIGPGAGVHGGNVVFNGKVAAILSIVRIDHWSVFKREEKRWKVLHNAGKGTGNT